MSGKQLKIETPQATVPDKRLRPKREQTEKPTELEAIIEDQKQGGLFDGNRT